jgi:hypothetical protein
VLQVDSFTAERYFPHQIKQYFVHVQCHCGCGGHAYMPATSPPSRSHLCHDLFLCPAGRPSCYHWERYGRCVFKNSMRLQPHRHANCASVQHCAPEHTAEWLAQVPLYGQQRRPLWSVTPLADINQHLLLLVYAVTHKLAAVMPFSPQLF